MDVFQKNGVIIAGLLFVVVIAVIIYFVVKEEEEDEKKDTNKKKDMANLVAVGLDSGGGNTILYSSDGISWNPSIGGVCFGYAGVGVAYGTSNGTSPLWVAVGQESSGDGGGNTILYSSDGISWNPSIGGVCFGYAGVGVAYGTSKGTSSPLWVAVGQDSGAGGAGGDTILYSSDGISWNPSIGGVCFGFAGRGVAYGTSNGISPLWVAVGQDGGGGGGNTILYSSDGISWNPSIGGVCFGFIGYGVAYGTSKGTSSPLWVAVGQDSGAGGGGGDTILYSSDGISWNPSIGGVCFGFAGSGVAFDHLLYGMNEDYYKK
jgi:hypothetical protein